MDPVLIASILTLAGIVITTFGPSAIRATEAILAGGDPVAAIAAEDVGQILGETSRLDAAMSAAHAAEGHRAAAELRALLYANDLTAVHAKHPAVAVALYAVSIHDLKMLEEAA